MRVALSTSLLAFIPKTTVLTALFMAAGGMRRNVLDETVALDDVAFLPWRRRILLC